jgi:hypothetical protein
MQNLSYTSSSKFLINNIPTLANVLHMLFPKVLVSFFIFPHQNPIYLSYSLDQVPHKFNFIFAISQFDCPII